MVVGREPGDVARLFASPRDRIGVIVVDLDSHEYEPAWLSAMDALARKVPALAISRLDLRSVKHLSARHSAHLWLSKPATHTELMESLKSLLALRDCTDSGQCGAFAA
jgi:hypothetical protein